MIKHLTLIPATGKRLIAKAIAVHPTIQAALKSGTLAIIAGTTNGYVAEEILKSIGQSEGFSKKRFFRGVVISPQLPVTESRRLKEERGFPGDAVIASGTWQRGKTIFDVVGDLKEGDVILTGANDLDLTNRQAAVLYRPSKRMHCRCIPTGRGGTEGKDDPPCRPVETRVNCNLRELATRMNLPGIHGSRLLPVPGEVFTEIDAISLMTRRQGRTYCGRRSWLSGGQYLAGPDG